MAREQRLERRRSWDSSTGLKLAAQRLIAVQDSWAALPPTMFFNQTEDSDWDNYRDLLDEDGNITLNLGAWLVLSGGTTILVDSGIGGRPTMMPLKEPPALPTVMQEAGVSPNDIDIVAFSHLHFDHTGWNTWDNDGTPVPQFPNARHIIQQAEWDYWTGSDELKEGAQYDNVLGPIVDAGLVDFVEGEHALTSKRSLTVPTPGPHARPRLVRRLQRRREGLRASATPRTTWSSSRETDWCPGADVRHDRLDRQPAPAVRSDRIRKRPHRLGPLQLPRPRPGRSPRRRPLLRGGVAGIAAVSRGAGRRTGRCRCSGRRPGAGRTMCSCRTPSPRLCTPRAPTISTRRRKSPSPETSTITSTRSDMVSTSIASSTSKLALTEPPVNRLSGLVAIR